MEESLKIIADSIKKSLPVKVDLRTYSPLTLAYIGDAVYDFIVKTLVVSSGNCKPQRLHVKTTRYVKAKAQAKAIEALSECLSEPELAVYKRGYNSKPNTIAKNSGLEEYLKATGFEALLGYLYLENNIERLLEIVKKSIDIIDGRL